MRHLLRTRALCGTRTSGRKTAMALRRLITHKSGTTSPTGKFHGDNSLLFSTSSLLGSAIGSEVHATQRPGVVCVLDGAPGRMVARMEAASQAECSSPVLLTTSSCRDILVHSLTTGQLVQTLSLPWAASPSPSILGWAVMGDTLMVGGRCRPGSRFTLLALMAWDKVACVLGDLVAYFVLDVGEGGASLGVDRVCDVYGSVFQVSTREGGVYFYDVDAVLAVERRIRENDGAGAGRDAPIRIVLKTSMSTPMGGGVGGGEGESSHAVVYPLACVPLPLSGVSSFLSFSVEQVGGCSDLVLRCDQLTSPPTLDVFCLRDVMTLGGRTPPVQRLSASLQVVDDTEAAFFMGGGGRILYWSAGRLAVYRVVQKRDPVFVLASSWTASGSSGEDEGRVGLEVVYEFTAADLVKLLMMVQKKTDGGDGGGEEVRGVGARRSGRARRASRVAREAAEVEEAMQTSGIHSAVYDEDTDLVFVAIAGAVLLLDARSGLFCRAVALEEWDELGWNTIAVVGCGTGLVHIANTMSVGRGHCATVYCLVDRPRPASQWTSQ